jgi:uncharacterized protein (DUF302 family)
MISSHRFWAPCGAPLFLQVRRHFLLALSVALVFGAVEAADDIDRLVLNGSDFSAAHEALIEVVEAEGLVVSAVIPFNQMLERTAGSLEKSASPYLQAEIVQFCSSVLAWQMVEEDPAQLALCPMSMALYVSRQAPSQVTLVWRLPAANGSEKTAGSGRERAGALLQRLAKRTAELSRQHW